jgi:hypothetical protein
MLRSSDHPSFWDEEVQLPSQPEPAIGEDHPPEKSAADYESRNDEEQSIANPSHDRPRL